MNCKKPDDELLLTQPHAEQHTVSLCMQKALARAKAEPQSQMFSPGCMLQAQAAVHDATGP